MAQLPELPWDTFVAKKSRYCTWIVLLHDVEHPQTLTSGIVVVVNCPTSRALTLDRSDTIAVRCRISDNDRRTSVCVTLGISGPISLVNFRKTEMTMC